MSTLIFFQFSQKNLQRCEETWHKIDSWTPTDWACALAGEVGEACNLVKKLKRLEDGIEFNITLTKEELIKCIGDELGDIIAYADLLAQRLGLNLDECVRDKFNEVSDRINSDVKL